VSDPARKPPFALMAEFHSSRELIDAIREARQAGYKQLEAYTPYPIEEVWEELGHHRSWLPLIVLIGGIFGCLAGFFLQYWASVINYPLNVGGRPLNSWVAFMPVTFETTVLFAAGAAVLGMFALNKLPMPYHPVFSVERFALASRDRYFLAIAAWDEQFDRVETERFLETLNPHEVALVES
jgi:hypothetical protein